MNKVYDAFLGRNLSNYLPSLSTLPYLSTNGLHKPKCVVLCCFTLIKGMFCAL